MIKEHWKWIPGFEGKYKVSSVGRIKSVSRNVPCAKGKGYRTICSRILTAVPDGKYHVVSLGHKNRTFVHIAVLTAFCGPCPIGKQCRHLNDVGTDNRIENLKWGTPIENADDARNNGHTKITGGTEIILEGRNNIYPN